MLIPLAGVGVTVISLQLLKPFQIINCKFQVFLHFFFFFEVIVLRIFQIRIAKNLCIKYTLFIAV